MNFDERDDPFSNEADDDVQGTLTDDEMSEQDTEAERDEYLDEEEDDSEDEGEEEDDDDESDDDSPQALGRTIERGVLFLNEQFPGWYHYVDLDTLDVANAYECPMAQASRQGDYLLGYYETDVPAYERHAHAVRHGFLDGDQFSDNDLNMGWQVAVRVLRLTR